MVNTHRTPHESRMLLMCLPSNSYSHRHKAPTVPIFEYRIAVPILKHHINEAICLFIMYKVYFPYIMFL